MFSIARATIRFASLKYFRFLLVLGWIALVPVASKGEADNDPAIRVALEGSWKLEVTAFWDPIADSTYQLHLKPENSNYFKFNPAQKTVSYDASAFNAFVPSTAVRVGEIWRLDPEKVLPFLKQFHPS